MNKSKEPQPTTNSASCSDDYSDMPRLIPFHQMETENGSPLTEEPPLFMTKTPPLDDDVLKTTELDTLMEDEGKNSEQNHEITAVSQEKAKKRSDDDIPKIAITPAMNVTDLVEQLMSHMDPQQRKQFASAIQSKVAIDDTTAVDNSNTITTSTTITITPDTSASNAINATADIVTSATTVATANITATTISAASTCDSEIIESKESEHEVAVQTEFVNVSKVQSCESQNVESGILELRNGISEKKRKTRKRKNDDYSESVLGKPTRKMKRREVDLRLNDAVVGCSTVDELTLDEKINVNSSKRQVQVPLSSRNSETEVQIEERKCRGRKKHEERKKFIAEKKFPARKLEKKKTINEEIREGRQEFAVSVAAGEPNTHLEYSDENMVGQIRELHLDMKRKVNEQLKIVIEQVGRQFANLELNFGDRKHWDLPWYRLNWKEITRRFAVLKTKLK